MRRFSPDPAFWQQLEAFGLSSLDDLDLDAEHAWSADQQFSLVYAIGEDRPHRLSRGGQAQQQREGSIAVLHRCGVDNGCQQMTVAVYRDVAFAAFDPFARVIAALPPFSAILAICE